MAHPFTPADPTASETACFVAGTLVHTQDGLKAIEQIKVGDHVLSKPDGGEGAPDYRPVMRTVMREDRLIWLVQYVRSGEMTAGALLVTGDHPFWVDRLGWTATWNLMGGHDLWLAGCKADEGAYVYRVIQVLATETPDIGWAGGRRNTDGLDMEEGPTVDLRSGGIKVSQPDEDAVNHEALSMEQDLKRRVYGLEVGEFNTYYVGEAGVWVRGYRES